MFCRLQSFTVLCFEDCLSFKRKWTTVDLSNSHQPHSPSHSGLSLSVCLKSILMDRYVAITGFWHLGFNMNIYCFFNGIDTVRNTIASTLHNEKKSWTCQRTLSEILLLTETNRAVKYFFSILKNPNLIFFCCVKYCEMQLKMTSIHLS